MCVSVCVCVCVVHNYCVLCVIVCCSVGGRCGVVWYVLSCVGVVFMGSQWCANLFRHVTAQLVPVFPLITYYSLVFHHPP